MRRLYLLLIGAGIIVFLAVSAILARAFSVDGAERAAVTSLVQAEARDDMAAMRSLIAGCSASAACRDRMAADGGALRRSGAVTIITIQTSSGFSLTGSVGTARVVWSAGGSLPIVQCVRVRRAGNVVSGLHIELLEISARLRPSSSPCPARY